MLTSIDVKFIFDSARLGFVRLRKYSPNSRCRPSSYLLTVLVMFLDIISPSSYSTSEMSAIFVLTTKTIQPRPQVFSVNGALTCKKAALSTSSVH